MSILDPIKSDRDAPLILRYRAEPVAVTLLDAAGLGLPKNQLRVAERILTALWLEFHGLGRATSVSLRKEHYANRFGPLYKYAPIKAAVEALAQAGLIALNKTPPGSNRKRQSTIWLPEDVGRALPTPEGVAVDVSHDDWVVLRDEKGDPMPFRRTEDVSRMERDGRRLREAYAEMRIEVGGAERLGALIIGATASGNRVVVNDLDRAPCRIFNEDWKYGGRFYRVFWQQLPKPLRAQVRIDGEQTVEEDFPQLHPTLLYAKAGKPYDPLTQDVYSFAGDEARPLAKKVLNTLINAPSPKSALGAIAREVVQRSGVDQTAALKAARDLIKGAKKHNSAIAPFFGTGAGRWLQRLDSDIARTVTIPFLKQHGVAPLGVHDSFIVPARLQGVLQEAMHAALDSAIADLRRAA